MQTISMILFLITLFLFTRNIFTLMFSMENYNVHRKRLKQLKFEEKKETSSADLIDIITKPVINHIFNKFKPRNLEELELDLRMAKWDKYFSPIQYRAFNITFKIIGTVFFLLLCKASIPIALIWFVVMFFGVGFLFRNSINNRKEKLIMDFPDFIRITEGYLNAGMPFSKAVAESIQFIGKEWEPILSKFVVECDIKSIDEALDSLKEEVNLFEVKEFVALVKLTLEQGGDAKDSFSEQADKIREMQLDMIAIKIGKRQMMGIAIQAPLLIANLLVFGLPTVQSMLTFSSM